MSEMDKIAGLKEILELDPKNSFARYGLAMELAGRGETEAALAEFSTLLANDPDYTAGYFMAAQTLANEARIPEAIDQLIEPPERFRFRVFPSSRHGPQHDTVI